MTYSKNETQARSHEERNNGERSGATGRVSWDLSRSSRICLRVQGSSMLPWVRPGDIAILQKVLPDEIRYGDIVLFRREEKVFVHRNVEWFTSDGQNFIVTKGDANPHADGVIAMSEILARVERIYRGGRRIEFHSRKRRAMGVLIAHVSRTSRFWFALLETYRIAIRPARRLLGTLRFSPATTR